MAVYLFDTNQQLFKILPDNRLISSIQEQEITEDDSLLNDVLRVKLLADEELDKTHYMAVESHEGNSQSFDFYSIADIKTLDNTTELIGASAGPIELSGYVVKDIRPENRTIEYVANQILQGTEWRVGYVESNLPTITDTFFYLSAKDSLKKLQSYGCEVVFKVEISGQGITDKWIEIYKQMGDRTNERFTYGSNALTVEREISFGSIYTALIGRGKGEETESGGYGRKLSFADVEWKIANGDPVDKPFGQDYVEIPGATEIYGIHTSNGKVPKIGIVEFNETKDPAQLIKETFEHLINISRPQVQFKSKVVNIGNRNIGDTVTIHRYDLGFHYATRIFKVTRDKLDNNRTDVSLGDFIVQSSIRKQSKINSALSNLQSGQVDLIEQVNFVSKTADGKNNINFGNDEPATARTGDLWYRDHPSLTGEKQMLIWDGSVWVIQSDTSDLTEAKRAITEQKAALEEVKTTADYSYDQLQQTIANSGFIDLDTAFANVQTLSEQAESNADEAMQKAIDNASLIGGLDDSISDMSVAVDDINNSLTLKANTTEIDRIDGTITDINNELTTQAGILSSKISQTQLDGAIDGIQIGGRNLIKESDPIYAWTGERNVTADTGAFVYGTPPHYPAMYQIEVRAIDDSVVGAEFGWQQSGAIQGKPVVISKEWGKATAFIEERVNIGLRVRGGLGRIELRHIKVEKGNKATDWTPAPEDTTELISSIQTEWKQTFEEFETSVTGSNGRLTLAEQFLDGFRNTAFDPTTGQLSLTEQTIAGLQDTVSDPVNGLETRVTTIADGFQVLSNDVDGLEAQLSVTNENVLARVEKGDVYSQLLIDSRNILFDANDRIMLSANKVVIDATEGTFISGAVIENASIDSAKISQIDGNVANIININADEIVSGNITGININGSKITNNFDIEVGGDGTTSIRMIGNTVIEGNIQTTANITDGGTLTSYIDPAAMGAIINNSNGSIRSQYHLDSSGLTLQNGSVKTYVGDGGFRLSSDSNPVGGTLQYRSTAARIQLASWNGVELGSLDQGYYKRIMAVTGFPSIDMFYKVNMQQNRIEDISELVLRNDQASKSGSRIRNTYDNWLMMGGKWGTKIGDLSIDGDTLYEILRLPSEGSAILFRNLNMNGNTITNQSDARFKTNIHDYTESSLELIKSLNFVTFEYTETDKPEGIHFGLLAQEAGSLGVYDSEIDKWLIDGSKQTMHNTHALQELAIAHEKVVTLASKAYLKAGSNEERTEVLEAELKLLKGERE